MTTFAPGLAGLLPELRWRGMFHAASDGLEARLATGRSITGYNGFDPSGPWLHIGHLVPIFGLIHLQRHGGRPIALVGGGTGMIGDPSGTTGERRLLDVETIQSYVDSQRPELERFLDFSGERGALMINNLDWLGPQLLLDWLRDVGKHFTIPYMLAKDSVQTRLERGLSFTEFSYMLIQATDYAHLYRTLGVELQMGGADQWGNITAGLELIRRTGAMSGGAEPLPAADATDAAFALAYPLLLAPSGAKFGKSAGGDTVWLHPDGTTPYAFYQHWLNTDDRDVSVYLRWFTLFEPDEIEALEAELATHPEARTAQRRLAEDLTTRVHGAAAARDAAAVSTAAFSGGPIEDPAVLAALHAATDGFDYRAADAEAGLVPLLVSSGTFASNGEARRMIQSGGVSVNGARVAAADAPLPEPIAGEWLVIRVGKRRLRVGRRVG
ncbi:MAG TPA: tyrosine--tRNA ligase [Candidatus Limnocylindrales bacterium]